MKQIIKKWIIIICCGCLFAGCSPREGADAANTGMESMTDTDENAVQNAQEENNVAEISDSTTDTISDTLTETNSSDEPDVEENNLVEISDKVDEKAEPYIDAYVNLSSDTEIEGCEWMQYGDGQVLRVKVQYTVQPENDYQHKEDYFLFITQTGEVSNVIEVNYEDKGVPYGLETDCATEHELGWACGFDAHFEDVTFDGKDDLLIFVGYSGNSGAGFYCAYIYEDGDFRYERTFEHIPSYKVDAVNEVIYGEMRGSAESFYDYVYKYENGEFILLEMNES